MKNYFIFFILVLAQTVIANAKLTQGPGDGGGGDTCNNRPIESFKTDITTLPEYKQHIEPLLAKISPGIFKELFTLRDLLEPNNKNWYFVDCKLQDVPKSKKGLYMNSFQTAFQNDREIFVDASSYAKMTSENKAQLLLHEMLMALYLLNEINSLDICQLNSVRGKCHDDKIETQKATIKISRNKVSEFASTDISVSEAKVLLDEAAHQNIRALVNWTWANRNQLTEKIFTKKALEYKFNNWFTSIELTPEGDAAEILDLADVARSFKKYHLLRKKLVHCSFDKQLRKFVEKCQVKLKFEHTKLDDEFSSVSISLVARKIRDRKDFKFELGTSLPSKEANIMRYNLSQSEAGVTLRFIMNPPRIVNGQLPAVGHLTKIVHIDFKKLSKDELSIRSVSLKTYRWYSFEKITSKKGNISVTEVAGYNSPAEDLSEIFGIESTDGFFGVGHTYESKQPLGYIPN